MSACERKIHQQDYSNERSHDHLLRCISGLPQTGIVDKPNSFLTAFSISSGDLGCGRWPHFEVVLSDAASTPPHAARPPRPLRTARLSRHPKAENSLWLLAKPDAHAEYSVAMRIFSAYMRWRVASKWARLARHCEYTAYAWAWLIRL